MVVSKVWKLVQRPEGLPKVEDFLLEEEELPPCKEGDVLVEAVCWSVDPYLRYRARELSLGSVMVGSQVARITESRNSNWKVGEILVHYRGWRTHTLLTGDLLKEGLFGIKRLPDFEGLPDRLGIGVLGMPGNTAYFGFLEICEPKAGETVLVNGAAGAVGSAVVQIAKIKGCKVVAFSGSDEKRDWVKELGADFSFNYKTADVGKALSEAAPEGIHCFFDNVGGQFTAEALPHMAERGRVSVCGAISTYNEDKKTIGAVAMTSPFNEGTVIWKQLRIEGFLVPRWDDRWLEAHNQMKRWILEGKLKHKESIHEGFESIPKAFIGLFQGHNIGKMVVVP